MQENLKNKTVKGLFWGGLSSGAQQLLSLIFGVILGRILNADDYGMVGMLTIFSLIANSIQESGFTAAIANKKDITHEDYNAVFWFSILFSFFLYIILFFCAPLIAAFYGIPELIPLARYSFLGFFISSFGIAQNAYMFKNLMVKQKAVSLVISLTISGTVGVILAWKGMSYWGIATQNVVYIFCVVVCYWIFSPWRPTLNINIKPLKGMISFSSKLLITNIFTHVNNNLFTVLLGKLYTEREVGNYTQANKWNYLGYALVIDTLHNVSQPVLTTTNEDVDRQKNIFRKLLRFTCFISFPVMFGLSLIAHELIVIAITDKWLPAVEILQLLCISGAFIPVVRLYSNLMISRGRSNVYMWNNISLCIVQLIVVLLAYPYGMKTMFIVYVIINISWLLVWHYFAWKEIKISIWSALKDILPFAGIAAVSMFVAGFATSYVDNIYLVFAGKIVIAALTYFFLLWIAGATMLRESIQFLIKKKI